MNSWVMTEKLLNRSQWLDVWLLTTKISSSLSPGECSCQMWRISVKVFSFLHYFICESALSLQDKQTVYPFTALYETTNAAIPLGRKVCNRNTRCNFCVHYGFRHYQTFCALLFISLHPKWNSLILWEVQLEIKVRWENLYHFHVYTPNESGDK